LCTGCRDFGKVTIKYKEHIGRFCVSRKFLEINFGPFSFNLEARARVRV